MVPKPTANQQKFIDCIDRSILLQACVGTGKTFALAHRVVRAINSGINPERILCVTFTNRAAEEMQERIKYYCPQFSHKVVIRTFHSLCAWILRLEARELGIPQDFTIFDEDDAKELISQLNLPRELSSEQIYYTIQTYKMENRVVTPDGLPRLNHYLFKRIYTIYQQGLAIMKGLDFGDLIKIAHQALIPGGVLYKRWKKRFDLVQVDEMQDTHLMEYEIVAALAQHSQNLVLAGDFDQTIYEWRGSDPTTVIARFKQDFPGYLEIKFLENHRGTKTLIHAARSVVSSYGRDLPKAAESAPIGYPIIVKSALNEESEAEWIANQIKTLNAQGIPYTDIGVLCRTNRRASVISEIMQLKTVPHITVETYEFFRRQEVKDGIAYLKLLLNPEDRLSLHRILKRPARGIGEQTISKIEAHENIGLRITDFVSLDTLLMGDPFGVLLLAARNGTMVIFDCETTGLDPANDEIIELAALKIVKGRVVGQFHQYLRPTKSVGQSVYIHGITDDFLAAKGADPATVVRDFISFIGNAVLVGHNVTFDLRMLESTCKRYKINFTNEFYFDTLTLSRRFISASSYRLEDLAVELNLTNKPSHSALDDVIATNDLLEYLLPKIRMNSEQRKQIVRDAGHLFKPLAEQIARWRRLMAIMRPNQLLRTVLEESGLLAYYERDRARYRNIQELIDTAAKYDDLSLHPIVALQAFVNFSALARNIDRVDRSNRVTVITVHQAKGLEFNVVFMAGLSNNEFPSFRAVNENRELEERRLFYVRVTRAKQRLFLSYYCYNNRGRLCTRSDYLDLLPCDVVSMAK